MEESRGDVRRAATVVQALARGLAERRGDAGRHLRRLQVYGRWRPREAFRVYAILSGRAAAERQQRGAPGTARLDDCTQSLLDGGLALDEGSFVCWCLDVGLLRGRSASLAAAVRAFRRHALPAAVALRREVLAHIFEDDAPLPAPMARVRVHAALVAFCVPGDVDALVSALVDALQGPATLWAAQPPRGRSATQRPAAQPSQRAQMEDVLRILFKAREFPASLVGADGFVRAIAELADGVAEAPAPPRASGKAPASARGKALGLARSLLGAGSAAKAFSAASQRAAKSGPTFGRDGGLGKLPSSPRGADSVRKLPPGALRRQPSASPGGASMRFQTSSSSLRSAAAGHAEKVAFSHALGAAGARVTESAMFWSSEATPEGNSLAALQQLWWDGIAGSVDAMDRTAQCSCLAYVGEVLASRAVCDILVKSDLLLQCLFTKHASVRDAGPAVRFDGFLAALTEVGVHPRDVGNDASNDWALNRVFARARLGSRAGVYHDCQYAAGGRTCQLCARRRCEAHAAALTALRGEFHKHAVFAAVAPSLPPSRTPSARSVGTPVRGTALAPAAPGLAAFAALGSVAAVTAVAQAMQVLYLPLGRVHHVLDAYATAATNGVPAAGLDALYAGKQLVVLSAVARAAAAAADTKQPRGHVAWEAFSKGVQAGLRFTQHVERTELNCAEFGLAVLLAAQLQADASFDDLPRRTGGGARAALKLLRVATLARRLPQVLDMDFGAGGAGGALGEAPWAAPSLAARGQERARSAFHEQLHAAFRHYVALGSSAARAAKRLDFTTFLLFVNDAALYAALGTHDLLWVARDRLGLVVTDDVSLLQFLALNDACAAEDFVLCRDVSLCDDAAPSALVRAGAAAGEQPTSPKQPPKGGGGAGGPGAASGGAALVDDLRRAAPDLGTHVAAMTSRLEALFESYGMPQRLTNFKRAVVHVYTRGGGAPRLRGIGAPGQQPMQRAVLDLWTGGPVRLREGGFSVPGADAEKGAPAAPPAPRPAAGARGTKQGAGGAAAKPTGRAGVSSARQASFTASDAADAGPPAGRGSGVDFPRARPEADLSELHRLVVDRAYVAPPDEARSDSESSKSDELPPPTPAFDFGRADDSRRRPEKGNSKGSAYHAPRAQKRHLVTKDQTFRDSLFGYAHDQRGVVCFKHTTLGWSRNLEALVACELEKLGAANAAAEEKRRRLRARRRRARARELDRATPRPRLARDAGKPHDDGAPASVAGSPPKASSERAATAAASSSDDGDFEDVPRAASDRAGEANVWECLSPELFEAAERHSDVAAALRTVAMHRDAGRLDQAFVICERALFAARDVDAAAKAAGGVGDAPEVEAQEAVLAVLVELAMARGTWDVAAKYLRLTLRCLPAQRAPTAPGLFAAAAAAEAPKAHSSRSLTTPATLQPPAVDFAAAAASKAARRQARRRWSRDSARRASALNALGNVEFQAGNFEAALQCHRDQDRLASEAGDHVGVMVANYNHAKVLDAMGRADLAVPRYEAVAKLSRECEARTATIGALAALAAAHLRRSDDGAARTALEEKLRLARTLVVERPASTQLLRCVVDSLAQLAQLHRRAGRHGDARVAVQEQVALATKLGDAEAEGDALANLGQVLIAVRLGIDVRDEPRYHVYARPTAGAAGFGAVFHEPQAAPGARDSSRDEARLLAASRLAAGAANYWAAPAAPRAGGGGVAGDGDVGAACDEALACFERQLALAVQRGDDRARADALENAAAALALRGDVAAALDALADCLEVVEGLAAEGPFLTEVSGDAAYLDDDGRAARLRGAQGQLLVRAVAAALVGPAAAPPADGGGTVEQGGDRALFNRLVGEARGSFEVQFATYSKMLAAPADDGDDDVGRAARSVRGATLARAAASASFCGAAALLAGDVDAALRHHQAELRLANEAGDSVLVAAANVSLGFVSRRRWLGARGGSARDAAAAVAHYEAYLLWGRGRGDAAAQGHARVCLAAVYAAARAGGAEAQQLRHVVDLGPLLKDVDVVGDAHARLAQLETAALLAEAHILSDRSDSSDGGGGKQRKAPAEATYDSDTDSDSDGGGGKGRIRYTRSETP
ncbi:hypothetical protein M885DRAFT_532769 [Pelagophyceae sp. CCMP2097]|nr:hypothetical protein M885DRAFT_532769 [Pelagophyceae sp. CCMP2097]